MAILWTRYATDAPPDGNNRMYHIHTALPEGDDPVYEITAHGPLGGAIEPPTDTCPAWRLGEYQFLPVGFSITVDRIR